MGLKNPVAKPESMKFLISSILLFSLVGCNSIPTATTSPAGNSKAISSKPVSTGIWDLKVLGIKREGRILEIQQGVKEEAVNTWLIVEVSVKNKSKDRQDSTNIPITFSKVETTSGKNYSVSALRSLLYSNAKREPFEPGEERKFKLLFDTPAAENPEFFVPDFLAEKPEKIKL